MVKRKKNTPAIIAQQGHNVSGGAVASRHTGGCMTAKCMGQSQLQTRNPTVCLPLSTRRPTACVMSLSTQTHPPQADPLHIILRAHADPLHVLLLSTCLPIVRVMSLRHRPTHHKQIHCTSSSEHTQIHCMYHVTEHVDTLCSPLSTCRPTVRVIL